MTDKEKRIKQAYNDILETANERPETLYDGLKREIKFLELLGKLYEAGRTEGLLTNITE